MAVEYLGGKRKKCGYDKYVGALEFHYVDGAKGYTRSWEKVKKNLINAFCSVLIIIRKHMVG